MADEETGTVLVGLLDVLVVHVEHVGIDQQPPAKQPRLVAVLVVHQGFGLEFDLRRVRADPGMDTAGLESALDTAIHLGFGRDLVGQGRGGGPFAATEVRMFTLLTSTTYCTDT